MTRKLLVLSACLFATGVVVHAAPDDNKHGFFDRLGDAWDDLFHGPRDAENKPIIPAAEGVQAAMSASAAYASAQASLSSAAASAASALSSQATATRVARAVKRAPTGAVPDSDFDSDELWEDRKKRSLVDSVKDVFSGDEDDNPADAWVWGDTVVEQDAAAEEDGSNAILLSGSASTIKAKSMTATASLLKISPTSLSGDQVESILDAMSAAQSSAMSEASVRATATTSSSSSSMTAPASATSTAAGAGDKVTLVIDAAFVQSALAHRLGSLASDASATATATATASSDQTRMTPAPAMADVAAAFGAGPGVPVIVELDADDNESMLVKGVLPPVLPTPVPAPVPNLSNLEPRKRSSDDDDEDDDEEDDGDKKAEPTVAVFDESAVRNGTPAVVHKNEEGDVLIPQRPVAKRAPRQVGPRHGMQMRVKRRHMEEFPLKRQAKARE